MGRPLVFRAFELAEKLGGMTAFELMRRMTREEILMWPEYFRVKAEREAENPSLEAVRFACLMAKLDWIKGKKNPDPKIYLPKKKKRTYAEIKAHFDGAVAASKLRSQHGR